MGEEGVPVWGIETGRDIIRAARVSRRPEGGFFLLDYTEAPTEGGGPEGLVSFIRKKGLRHHPLVVAIQSPAGHIGTADLPPEDANGTIEDVRLCLMEFVHAEPETIDLRFGRVDGNRFRFAVEERARVESYLVALEAADVGCYSLVSELEALYGAVLGTGLFEGDGIVVSIEPSVTDLLFIDEGRVRHLGLPIGSNTLATGEGRDAFRDDFARLLEYHRSRNKREEPERIVVVGLDEKMTEAVADCFPDPLIPFPGNAAAIRGKGRISLMRGLNIIRRAPAAVGAAAAGVAEPRHLQLSFRDLPRELPPAPQPIGAWLAAALLLWLAIAAAWFGSVNERDRLKVEVDLLGGSIPPAISASTARRLEELNAAAKIVRDLPGVIHNLARSLPGIESAPSLTESFSIEISRAGECGATASVLLLEASDDRVNGTRAKIERNEKARVEVEARGKDTVIRIRIQGETP